MNTMSQRLSTPISCGGTELPLRVASFTGEEYLDLDDTQHLDRFIGELYDRERLHSSLCYVPPAEFAAR